MRTRSKSDHVWRLVKTVGPGLFTKLKAYNDVYAKGSKQWKLFEYYWHMEAWTREQEKRDWEGENLPSLKYRTYKWLVRGLASVGDYPHEDLHRLVQDIKFQMARRCWPEIMDYFPEVHAIARKGELFQHHLEILALEQLALRRSYMGKQRVKRLQANIAETGRIMELLADLSRFHRIRVKYFDPIMVQYEKDSTYDRRLLARMKKAEALQDETACESVRARHEFHTLWVFIHTLDGNPREAMEHANVILEQYRRHRWLRDESIEEYALALQRFTALGAVPQDRDFVLSVMRELDKLDLDDPTVLCLTVEKVIAAKFYLALRYDIREMGDRAVQLLDQHQNLISLTVDLKRRIWLHFYSAIHQINAGVFRKALDHLDVIEEFKKSNVKLDVRVHARTMRLICLFGAGAEPTDLEAAAISSAKFITRKGEHYKLVGYVAKLFGKAGRIGPDIPALVAMFRGGRNHLAEMAKSLTNRTALAYFDYIAWIDAWIARNCR